MDLGIVEEHVIIVEVKTIIVISFLYVSSIDQDTTHKSRQSALLGYPTGASHLNSCQESRHIGTFQYFLASVGVIIPDHVCIKIRSHVSKVEFTPRIRTDIPHGYIFKNKIYLKHS